MEPHTMDSPDTFDSNRANNSTATGGGRGNAQQRGANGSSEEGGLDTGAQSIGDMARNFASQAQQKAGEQMKSTIDTGRTGAAERLSEVARTLKATGEDDQSPTSKYMNRAGDQVQRAADYIQKSDMQTLMSDTEQFARRQPALFIGGAFAIGILAARFLKSTRDTSSHDSNGQSPMYDREREMPSYREPAAAWNAPSGRASAAWDEPSGSSYNTMAEEE